MFVLQWYGVTSLSLKSFFRSALRDGIVNRYNMSECTMLATMFTDFIHPGRPLGKILLADLLMNQLVSL